MFSAQGAELLSRPLVGGLDLNPWFLWRVHGKPPQTFEPPAPSHPLGKTREPSLSSLAQVIRLSALVMDDDLARLETKLATSASAFSTQIQAGKRRQMVCVFNLLLAWCTSKVEKLVLVAPAFQEVMDVNVSFFEGTPFWRFLIEGN